MKGRDFEFRLMEADIKERARFGGFELLRTVNGIMYRNNAGFHLWCAPYVAGLDGKAKETSLYSALSYLMDLGRGDVEWKDVEGVLTKERMEEALSLAVECTCTWPLVAFTETGTSAADFFGINAESMPAEEREKFSMPVPYFFAERFMEYLRKQARDLQDGTYREESDADARILAEDMNEMEQTETLIGIAGEHEGDGDVEE